MNSRNADWKRYAGLSISLLLALAAGILAERSGLLPGSRYAADAPGEPFWEAWRLVQLDYVDRKAAQPARMTEGSIRGMVAFLGDTGHTTYLSAEEFSELEKNLKGELEGIGARLTLRKGRLTVVQTFPDSPARKGGLLPGDVLQEVAGQHVQGLSLQKTVELVRGPPGSTLRLRILRKGAVDPIDLSLRRQKVNVPDVSWHFLPGAPIAHLAILEFGTEADAQLRAALQEAKEKGAKGLIIDVRGNPGGLKDQAVAVTSEFLSGGAVFIEQDANGNRTKVPVEGGGRATQIPLCVLIDQGTASSAEIFAGAIQDHHRGKLIGTRTFGTGTVLEPFRLSDGSVILLAVREWLTPLGRPIWHKGISPDVEVTLPEGGAIVVPDEESKMDAAALAKCEDRQLLKALELLKNEIRP